MAETCHPWHSDYFTCRQCLSDDVRPEQEPSTSDDASSMAEAGVADLSAMPG